MQRPGITVVFLPHNDLARALTRLRRDLVPSLEAHADWDFELLVIDNSSARLEPLERAVAALPWRSEYIWHDGQNLQYGPSLNLAANLAAHPVMVYACANHGRMHDPTWLDDLALPFWNDAKVAMTGHPYPSPPPSSLGFRDRGEHFHIQGGVLGLRTEIIRRYPYHEGEFAHWGSDIWQSYRLMDEGFALRDVPSVFSVWRERAPSGSWKYVHDHSDD